MTKLYGVFVILLFASNIFCQTEQLIKQPERVFIQSSYKSPTYEAAKEVVLIYLEDALGDKNGDLLLQVKYKGTSELLGKAYNPISNESWYFYAEWNLTTKGGGYLIYKIDYTKYKNMFPSYYNTLN
ncbi:MAG: hypothetical protein STSR0008_23840 [Ignavibacterium sp.]